MSSMFFIFGPKEGPNYNKMFWAKINGDENTGIFYSMKDLFDYLKKFDFGEWNDLPESERNKRVEKYQKSQRLILFIMQSDLDNYIDNNPELFI